jgi:hypothetical protein
LAKIMRSFQSRLRKQPPHENSNGTEIMRSSVLGAGQRTSGAV